MSTLITELTDSTFEQEVLKNTLPVLVDFWAEWCGPCKMIAPILVKIAETYQGKLKIAKLNVDKSSKMSAQYGIRGIPTLMLFKNGQVEATKVGGLSQSQLTEFLDGHL